MNLPSDVPPSVEHKDFSPVTSYIEFFTASIRSDPLVRNGFPPTSQFI